MSAVMLDEEELDERCGQSRVRTKMSKRTCNREFEELVDSGEVIAL